MSRTEFRRIAATVQPTKFLDYRDYLAAVYRQLKEHYGTYSYIRFTEDMGFGSCNAMHLITHGDRPLTVKGVRKIIEAIGLTGVERQFLLKLVTYSQLSESADREKAFEALVDLKSRALPTVLEKRQLEFYNNWYNAAILELLSLGEAQDDPVWIAARLTPRVAPLRVKQSLDLLKELGHLTYNVIKKRLVPTHQILTTGSEVYGMAVIRYHQQMIDLAKESITRIAPDDRDVSGVTVAVSKEMKQKLKAEIIAFRSRLLELSKASENAEEIVQVNVQMFPVASGSKKGKGHVDEE